MRIMRHGFSAIVGTAAVIGAALLVPTSASAAPAFTESETEVATACQVESASVSWGVKQSFRQYITGAIAGGSWETYGEAAYVAPSLTETGAVEAGTDLFQWVGGTGEIANTLESGAIAFVGGVHFTGHDGELELNIANPAVEFEGADTGYLLLEVSEAPVGEAGTQVRAAKLDLSTTVSASGQDLSIVGASVRLTAEGAAAFNGDTDRGTYVAGEEMDPLYLQATVAGCELGEVVAVDQPSGSAEEATAAPISAAPEAESAVPWVPIVIGGVALIVIGVAAGMLIAGRKKPEAEGPASSTEL
ncbi:HtaA domain-containing protein [Leucobacter sp. W1153]|uniref:HtaA domain-containing protein n=1 Tax=Leucobacter sp. W1153 TaxID=3439064 RepID=UPI003F3F7EE8